MRMCRMVLWVCVGLAGSPWVCADPGFEAWIRGFRAEAVQQGVRGEVYDAAFRDVREIDAAVLEKAAYQPEFKTEAWEYIDNRVTERAIRSGQALLAEQADVLAPIEQRTGVDRHVLMAIWSMESNYGAVLADRSKLHYLPQALATLAYGDPARASFSRSQLVAALKILQRGDVSQDNLLGSWAGAMGHTQFIPTSYLAYAVDADGDGRCDIWHSIPDALATAARLLEQSGWRTGEGWGYEVRHPHPPADDSARTLAQWQSAGFRPVQGARFPDDGRKAELRALQGERGPAFLVTKNFFVVKRYNNADKYALAVLLLADRLAGRAPPVQDWVRPYTPLTQAEKEELQQRLAARGFYSGVVDGLIGNESRRAIAAFQASAGVPQDAYPSKEVLLQLRQAD